MTIQPQVSVQSQVNTFRPATTTCSRASMSTIIASPPRLPITTDCGNCELDTGTKRRFTVRSTFDALSGKNLIFCEVSGDASEFETPPLIPRHVKGSVLVRFYCFFPITGAGGLSAKNPPSGASLPGTGRLSIRQIPMRGF